MSDEIIEPGLYLVATPLGHLGDLSSRAREILSRASFLAGESQTKVKQWFEILFGGDSQDRVRPGLLSYRESNRERDGQVILEKLEQGYSVALLSDAGTPCISDPGWQVVAHAREKDFPIWSIPGPCAAITALAASGFPSRQFHFEGFLNESGRAKRQAWQRLQDYREPVVIYESPHRFLETLGALAEKLPQREIFVAREMTKKFEECWRGPLAQATEYWQARLIKGEFTLVVGPELAEAEEDSSIPSETYDFIKGLNLPTKTATSLLLHFYPQVNKKKIYQELLPKS